MRSAGSGSSALLLDTQILVWLGTDDPRLKPSILSLIADALDLKVSAVTAWEFVDLNMRGRFPSDIPFKRLMIKLGAELLDFPAEAWSLANELPDIHRDPVDRMLIAHAIHADLPIVTADKLIRAYPVRTLW